MATKFVKGSMVWVKHSTEAWIHGMVGDVLEDNFIEVFFPDGSKQIVKVTSDHPLLRMLSCDGDIQLLDKECSVEKDYDQFSDDFTKITHLITPAVLHLLRTAYMKEKYYCKLGSGTLLALNPFKEVQNLVSSEMLQTYNSCSLDRLQNLPPHIYSVAQNALVAVRAKIGKTNQSIIVSGESGAGKTWTVGCMMRYLSEAEVSHKCDYLNGKAVVPVSSDMPNVNSNNNIQPQDRVLPQTTDATLVDKIEKRILNSNPILEAFGNAQTQRNDNSSRFGKYIQLQYNRSGHLIGAQLKTYLLEKIRVVERKHGQYCFHIFYQMHYGSSLEEKEDWKLPNNPFPDSRNYSECFRMRHGCGFDETRTAMKRLGIADNIQCRIFKVLSAVLHLRQLAFRGSDDLQNPSNIDQSNSDHSGSLSIASELLGLDEEALLKVIIFRMISARSTKRKSVFLRPSTVEECHSRRDCLIKFIYQSLFQWIVRGVGERISALNSKCCNFIGLLDIYGFESFENNSLEQLCINYANEKLQHHFATTFLQKLQDEYFAEGVNWVACDLSNNVGCLVAMEAPRNSLFSLLDEECRLNRTRAERHLKSRIEAMFPRNEHIIHPRISSAASSFSIIHYARQVSYKTEFLIEKNKDEVPAEFFQALAMSKNGFVRQLVSYGQNAMDKLSGPMSQEDGTARHHIRKNKTVPTVLTRFKKSLDDLLDILSMTDCHYVRCIKPNKESLPMVFDSQFVLDQMEASGVVNTIKICAPAYPYKMTYRQFHARYFFRLRDQDTELVKNQEPSKYQTWSTIDDSIKENCLRILKSVRNVSNSPIANSMQFGKSKIFLSSSQFEALEDARSKEIVKMSVIIQTVWRKRYIRLKCRAERKTLIAKKIAAAHVLQTAWRRKLHFRICRQQRKCLVATYRKCVSTIQSAWISYKRARMNRESNELVRCATTIQAAFRGWQMRCRYRNLRTVWRQVGQLSQENNQNIAQERLHSLIGRDHASYRTNCDQISSCINAYSQAKLAVYYDDSISIPISQNKYIQDDVEPADVPNDVLFDRRSKITDKSSIRQREDSSTARSPVTSQVSNWHICSGGADAIDSFSFLPHSRNECRQAKNVKAVPNRFAGSAECASEEEIQDHLETISTWHRLPSISLMKPTFLKPVKLLKLVNVRAVIFASGSPNVNIVKSDSEHVQSSTAKLRLQFCNSIKRGSFCILKYADVPPNRCYF